MLSGKTISGQVNILRAFLICLSKAVLNAFNRRCKPDAEDISDERALKCCAVEIRITEMTGRQERERKRTCWRYRF